LRVRRAEAAAEEECGVKMQCGVWKVLFAGEG